MNKHLKAQLEQIIDEGSGHTRSVIVQMGDTDDRFQHLVEAAGRTARERNMLTDVRSLLPPNAVTMKVGKSGRRSVVRNKHLKAFERSMAAQVARGSLGIRAKQKIKSDAHARLRPLTSSSFLKTAIDNAKISSHGAKTNVRRRHMNYFWSAASAVIKVKKDALWELPENVKGIADIFSNRRILVPPVVAVRPESLPQSVQDNKICSWGIQATGALAAWGAYGAWGEGVKVAVLDTGVDNAHPDLAGRIADSDWAEFDDDGNQVIGAQIHDSGKHGTHCCGTVAGGDHSGKWIGMAPDAQLAVGLVLKGGSGTTAQILGGIDWAIERGVDVISMSLGGLQLGADVVDIYTRSVLSANELGIPVVVAIGNEGSQTTGMPGNDYFAFAVGATDVKDRAAGFSGGRTHIITESRYIPRRYLPLVYSKPDVSAPGVAITSSIPGQKYDTWNGTSMATPHVAGAIALLLSATDIRSKVATNELAFVIQDLISGSVEELGEAGKDHRYGYGRIDVLRAIGLAKELGY